MKIDYTLELLENETGPNLYFMGSMHDYFLLSQEIIKLLKSGEGARVCLNNLAFVNVVSEDTFIYFQNCSSCKELSKVDRNHIEISIPPLLWESLYSMSQKLSTRKGHFYVEFDELDLREDCNIIWSSEW